MKLGAQRPWAEVEASQCTYVPVVVLEEEGTRVQSCLDIDETEPPTKRSADTIIYIVQNAPQVENRVAPGLTQRA
jgi:hypothetical protein